MQNERMKLLIPVVVALLAGCQRGVKSGVANKPLAAPVPVTTALVTRASVAKELVVTGSLIAKSQVNVMPKTTGRLLELDVQEGDRVHRGEVIAKLEAPELTWKLQQQKSALLSAEASFDQAKDNLGRMSELAGEGAISQQQLEQAKVQARIAKSQVDQANAAISLMRTTMANRTITSPIDGLVLAKGLDPGGMATPQTAIVTIAQAGQLQAKLAIAERDLGMVQPGGVVTVSSVAFPDETFRARIREVAPMVDPQTRLVTVKADLDDSRRLKVGMNVKATLKGPTHTGLVVPSDALVSDGAEVVVYLAQDAKARRVSVVTGVRGPQETEILGGLKAGDAVVVKGSSFVKDGDSLQVQGGR